MANSPYPFDTTLEQGPRKLNGRVLRLTTGGVLVEIGTELVTVGQDWLVHLKLPGSEEVVSLRGKLIKSYRRIMKATGVNDRLVEVQFMRPTSDQTQVIHNFLVKTGQAVLV